MTAIETYLLTPLKDVLYTVGSLVPSIVSVFVALILGYFIAKLLRDVLHRVFKEVHIDKVADKLGLSKLLSSGGVKHSLGHLTGAGTYLVVIFTFLLMTMRTVGIGTMPDYIGGLIAYITPVITAVFILVVGHVLAKLVGGLIYLVVSMFELPKPDLHERISRWAILLYTIKMSLSVLGFDFLFSGTVLHIWFAGVVLALALAFGLGGRDKAAKYLSDK